MQFSVCSPLTQCRLLENLPTEWWNAAEHDRQMALPKFLGVVAVRSCFRRSVTSGCSSFVIIVEVDSFWLTSY
jgi:hypothetical protein